MIGIAIALLMAAGLGFGAGRVKNAKKLAAVSAEVASIEAYIKSGATYVVADVIAAVKKHL